MQTDGQTNGQEIQKMQKMHTDAS